MTTVTEAETLRRILRGGWPSLPALLCASVATCTAAVAVVFLAPGITPVSALLAALLLGPPAAALTATVDRIAVEGEASIGEWWTALTHTWWSGLGHALVPAVPTAMFLLSLEIWTATSALWVLPSLAVSGACGVLGFLGLPAVLSFRAHRQGPRARELWICALHLVARHPLRFLAAPVLAILGVWAATAWTASLLLLVPAPVAIVAGAAVWTSTPSVPER